jgi:soluble lytic murein transglycosylase-like protein
MPKFANDFGKLCGIQKVSEKDIHETEVNLTLGACYFKELLKNLNNNVAAALVGYNAGTASMSLKQIQNLVNITNQETVNYVSRFTYVYQEAKNKTQADIANNP